MGCHGCEVQFVVCFISIYLITTEVVNGEVICIQNYVIKFVSDLLQVGCFLRVIQFSPTIKLAATI